MMELDTVQIDVPEFDQDIEGPETQWAHHTTAVVSVHDIFTSPEPESANATNTQEETTARHQLDTTHSNSEDSHRSPNFSHQIPAYSFEDNFTGQQQGASTENNVYNNISQLEEE